MNLSESRDVKTMHNVYDKTAKEQLDKILGVGHDEALSEKITNKQIDITTTRAYKNLKSAYSAYLQDSIDGGDTTLVMTLLSGKVYAGDYPKSIQRISALAMRDAILERKDLRDKKIMVANTGEKTCQEIRSVFGGICPIHVIQSDAYALAKHEMSPGQKVSLQIAGNPSKPGGGASAHTRTAISGFKPVGNGGQEEAVIRALVKDIAKGELHWQKIPKAGGVLPTVYPPPGAGVQGRGGAASPGGSKTPWTKPDQKNYFKISVTAHKFLMIVMIMLFLP